MSAGYFTSRRVQALAARLSQRDRLLLDHVVELRYLSGGQLARLCFTDSDDMAANTRAARRALLRLVRLGVLERLPRSIGGIRAGSAGFIYRLGLAGHRLAVREGRLPARQRRHSLAPGTLFVRHSLQIAELHTRLLESERTGAIELLSLAAEPSCWRSYDGPGGQPARLKPDSYVRLGLGPYEDSYFIEVDRGTEGSRTLADQLERYVAYYESGREQREHGVFPMVLWLTPSHERAATIAACVQQLPAAYQPLFRVERFAEAPDMMLSSYNANDIM